MNDTIRWCFQHGCEVKQGKRACEYRLIWEREVLSSQIGVCDMADALVIRAPIDHEAAIERARTYLSHHASYEEQIRQAVDAALGGQDE